MKFSTLFGILIGLIAILGAYLVEGGNFSTLFLLPPMVIVIGGTLAAGTAGHSFEMMAKIPQLVKLTIFPPSYDTIKIMNQIIYFAGLARREGMLAVEAKLKNVEHPYMRKLFEICIDGADPHTLDQIVESETHHISERHFANINLFVKLGGYSPTMGIIGTVMGLISTLASAGEDPNVLIRHIASAFIATMWGILMANIFWLPVGDKLKLLHNQEMMLMQIITDGVKSVLLGETPSVIKARLAGALPLSEQKAFLQGQRVQFPGKEENKSENQINSD